MTDREVMQQALEALLWADAQGENWQQVVKKAIKPIQEAAAQPEPVHGDIRALKYRIHELEGEVMGYKRMLDVAEAAAQPPQQAEPVQEPFGYLWPTGSHPEFRFTQQKRDGADGMPLYTAPPQQQAEPVYKDSTPHLHVGDSAFESWFQAQPFATQTGIKQISRDSYAAGMGDPLVVAAPQQQAEPVAWHYTNKAGVSVLHCEPSARLDADMEAARDCPDAHKMTPLYTTAPQRKPLTDEEIDALAADEDGLPNSHLEFARAIEAAHGIKEGT